MAKNKGNLQSTPTVALRELLKRLPDENTIKSVYLMLTDAPEKWMAIDRDNLSAEQSRHFTYLLSAGLIEYRSHFRYRFHGCQSVKCRLQVSGTTVNAADMENLTSVLYAVQGHQWKNRLSNGEPSPSGCEEIGPGEWRVSAHGVNATRDLASNANTSYLTSFVFLPGPPLHSHFPEATFKADRIEVEGDPLPASLQHVRTEEVSPAVLEAIRNAVLGVTARDQFAEWIRSIRGLCRGIFERLYKSVNTYVSVKDLEQAGWPDSVDDLSPEAFADGMKRCQKLLNAANSGDPHCGYTLSKNADSWKLSSPHRANLGG